MTEIKRYKLDAAFVELKDFDICAKADGFIEVSMWHNGEGFDVSLSSHSDQSFGLTWGEYKAMKKLIKELDG
jgi:hypothetical protein